MALLGILTATLVAWVVGAMWYTMIEDDWLRASGLRAGRPSETESLDYVISLGSVLVSATALCILFAAMDVRYWLTGGLLAFGLSLGLALPWTVTNVRFGQRDMRLLWMDGIYPVLVLTIIGAILPVFMNPGL